MQFNLTAANQQRNMERLSTSLQQAQESARANNVKFNSAATNPNSIERTPEQDTCSFSNSSDLVASAIKTLAKSVSLSYLVGVGIGFCPGLFMLGAAAFLFANKNNDSFKEKITEAISKNVNAMNVLQQNAARQSQQGEGNIQNTQNTQRVQNTQHTENVQNARNVQNDSIVEEQEEVQADVEDNNIVAVQATEIQEIENETATNPIKNADNKTDCKMALKVLQNLTSQKANATRNRAGQEKIDSIQSEIDALKNHIKSTYSDGTIRSAKASLNFEAQRLENAYERVVKGN